MTSQQFDTKIAQERLAHQQTVQSAVSADLKQKRSRKQKETKETNMPEVQERPEVVQQPKADGKIQSISFLKRTALPVMRGPEGGTTISIGENGQFRFSAKVSDVAKRYKYAAVEQQLGPGRQLTIYLLTDLPKGANEKDFFELHWNAKSDNDAVYFSGIGICRQFGYDNKGSGTKAFEATVQPNKKHPQLGSYATVSINLPEGVAARDPNAPVRKRRTKVEIQAAKDAKKALANGGTRATPDSTTVNGGNSEGAGAGNATDTATTIHPGAPGVGAGSVDLSAPE